MPTLLSLFREENLRKGNVICLDFTTIIIFLFLVTGSGQDCRALYASPCGGLWFDLTRILSCFSWIEVDIESQGTSGTPGIGEHVKWLVTN